jgi:hypothetical protein
MDEPKHPLDDMMEELQEGVREIQEARERNTNLPRHLDPLFADPPVYDGPSPPDLSERHDDYLYEILQEELDSDS